MLVVLDNVLSDNDNQKVLDYIQTDGWVEGSSPLQPLLAIAGQYIDLSSMIGYEYWCNSNQQGLDWHTDKDEKLFHTSGQLELPLCSMVYYAKIQDLAGGEFISNSEIIRPVENRLVLFSAGLMHKVDPYTGTRIAVSINPWARRLE